MTNGKKFLITTRSSEIFVVRPMSGTALVFCPMCGTEREMVSLDDAVRMSSIGTRAVIGHVESGSLHAVETGDGRLLVCRDSLEEFTKGEKK